MASRLIGQSTQARVLRRSFLAFWSWIYRSAFAYASEFCFWGEFLKNVLPPLLATPGWRKDPINIREIMLGRGLVLTLGDIRLTPSTNALDRLAVELTLAS